METIEDASRLDDFAMAALVGISHEAFPAPYDVAIRAYAIAEAMMEERARRTPPKPAAPAPHLEVH